MTHAKELTKRPIYRIRDGQKLGDIRDLYLDSEARDVVALYLGKEGVFARRTLVLQREQVQVLGIDAWLAYGDAEVIDVKELAGSETFLLASELRGREIETPRQTKIGTVGDVVLDDEARVLGFSLSKVHVQGPLAKAGQVARGAVASLGADKEPMVVDMEAAEAAAMGESVDRDDG